MTRTRATAQHLEYVLPIRKCLVDYWVFLPARCYASAGTSYGSSVATGGHGGTCLTTPVRPGRGNCRNSTRKKLEVGWRYRIILSEQITLKCVFLLPNTFRNWIKYKRRITCHVFKYVFQILVFQLLDNSANKHTEQPSFFSCFTSGSCTLAKYTKLCMVWQPNIRPPDSLCPHLEILATPLICGPVSVSATSRCSIEMAERISLVFGMVASFHPNYTVL